MILVIVNKTIELAKVIKNGHTATMSCHKKNQQTPAGYIPQLSTNHANLINNGFRFICGQLRTVKMGTFRT